MSAPKDLEAILNSLILAVSQLQLKILASYLSKTKQHVEEGVIGRCGAKGKTVIRYNETFAIVRKRNLVTA